MPLETNLESVAAMLWLVWLRELVVVTFILHCVLYSHCLVTPLFTRDHDTPTKHLRQCTRREQQQPHDQPA